MVGAGGTQTCVHPHVSSPLYHCAMVEFMMKPSHFKSNNAQSFGDYLLVFSKRIQTNSLFTYVNFKIFMPVVLAHWMHRSITSTSQLQRFLLINIQDNIFQWISLTIVLNATCSSKGTFYSMCRRHYFDVRSSFNVWGAVNYPLTLMTNIRTLAFYTPRNNTLGNPPGENPSDQVSISKNRWSWHSSTNQILFWDG